MEYPGAIYHLMSRGDRAEAVFRDEGDRHDFIKTLGEACRKTGFQIHAYCLMKNHFHLVAETPDGNLAAGMRWLLSTYSNRFNKRHDLCGHVFSGRYKALVVEGGGNGYLRTACDYVHLNPVRARLLAPRSRLLEYPWSSFGLYLSAPGRRPEWLRVDRLLGEHGIRADTAGGRREFERRMETRRREEGDPRQWKGMRRGWCLGSESFRGLLLERGLGDVAASAEMRGQAARARAEKIIARELARRRWKESDLERRPKIDAGKVALAARLRRETALTIQEIARRLRMGSRNSLSTRLYEWNRNNQAKELCNVTV
jgi:putative transposase